MLCNVILATRSLHWLSPLLLQEFVVVSLKFPMGGRAQACHVEATTSLTSAQIMISTTAPTMASTCAEGANNTHAPNTSPTYQALNGYRYFYVRLY